MGGLLLLSIFIALRKGWKEGSGLQVPPLLLPPLLRQFLKEHMISCLTEAPKEGPPSSSPGL